MTDDPSGGRPPHEQNPPWTSPTDPPAPQSGADAGWADPASAPGPMSAPSPYGAPGPASGAPAYGAPQPASPWETPGTAAGGVPYGYPPQRRTNTMAIVAMCLSLAGIATCITAPVGAILGHVARRQLRTSGESGDGFALTAIIVGWVFTVLLVILTGLYVALIVFAVSQDPNL